MSKNEKSEVVEDFLDADPPIRGQNYACISFLYKFVLILSSSVVVPR